MESLLRKSLDKREKCLEESFCPEWLISILPTRMKSVQSIVDVDHETEEEINLSPYQLIHRIPLLNEQMKELKHFNFEYPNGNSFEYQQLNNYEQIICSPSNNQLISLLKTFEEYQGKPKENLFKRKFSQCQEKHCLNQSIPLTLFCREHLYKNDSKQILFSPCYLCQQISIGNNLFHHCYHI